MSSNNSSTIRFVLGIIGLVVFGSLLVSALVWGLILSSHVLVPLAVICAILVVLSGALLSSGLRRKNVIGRLSRYMAELSVKNDVMSIEDISAITGYLPSLIKSDIRRLKRWDLSFDLYSDKEGTTLMKGKGAYDQYAEIERRRQEMERDEAEQRDRLKNPETATLESFRIEVGAAIQKLHAANLMLPGDEVSDELDKLEQTMKRIASCIESHPEKLPETRKLMNYHLPTTMKLIEKYCQYDTMEYQPDNVAAAKTDIEKALAAANEAFSNFLEGLFNEDTLDVTTDAEVLQKMFEKDGLTGKKFDI